MSRLSSWIWCYTTMGLCDSLRTRDLLRTAPPIRGKRISSSMWSSKELPNREAASLSSSAM